MKYWDNLSTGKKVVHVLWALIGLFVLLFVLFNWKDVSVNLIFGEVILPVTFLIILSMACGYGVAKIISIVRDRRKDERIKTLEHELRRLKNEQKKSQATSSDTKSVDPK